ncbi:MAG: DUF6660 family protein [Pyrinomonadaceae bacterium]
MSVDAHVWKDLRAIVDKAKMNLGIIVRTFSLIFIVYIVMLLTQPCQDMVTMFDQCDPGSETAHIENPSADHDCAEGCSPFCICSCCGGSVVVNHLVSIAVASHSITTVISPTMSEYTSDDRTPFGNSVWQPPKA